LSAAHSAEPEQFFASIFWDNKKIGQGAHPPDPRRDRRDRGVAGARLDIDARDQPVRVHSGPDPDLEGRRAAEDAGQADDNGKAYAVFVERGASEYQGMVNHKARILPIEAFTNTLWHYGIVHHRLLFKQTDLDLLHVKVIEAKETIKLHGKSIATRRATFSGDFEAVVWFDEQDDFLQGQYEMNGRKIRVERDE
jgi:hypothetical protein